MTKKKEVPTTGWKGHMYRSFTTTQCNPLLFVAAFVVALGVLTYIYRQVIIETLEIIALVALGAGCLAIIGGLVAGGIRYHRRHAAFGPVAAGIVPRHEDTEPIAQSPYESTVGNPSPDEMAKEADWLADEHVTLAWDPSGQILKGGKVR